MGFISYNLSYFGAEIAELESGAQTEENKLRAKRLLKILCDLTSEGYTELSDKIEAEFRGVSRLKKYLSESRAEPFPAVELPKEADFEYSREEIELEKAARLAANQARSKAQTCGEPILNRLCQFCQWIGRDEATGYIFLLRDTLLPYICYKEKNKSGVYPWLLGRKTLSWLLGKNGVDDELRSPIYRALELGKTNFSDFCPAVLENMKKVLTAYPKLQAALTEMLTKIDKERIIVVESGCSGTFALLLMALDRRVDFRMYTTYPYLSSTYKGRIFTDKYEENSLVEALHSHNLLFRFSSLSNGHFFVNGCANAEIKEKALSEIKTVML